MSEHERVDVEAWAAQDDDRCGHTILDAEGIEEPCGRPASGHRWYEYVEHEPLLARVCDWHGNEGGRRMAALLDEHDGLVSDLLDANHALERAEAVVAKVRELVERLDYGVRTAIALRNRARAAALRDAADDLRLALLPDDEGGPRLPLHRTEAGWPNCSTCDGGGCPDCTDPA